MKFLALFCLAAAVTAEADPYYLGGYGLGYSGLGYAGLGYAGLGYAGLGYAGYAGQASVGALSSVNIAGAAPAAIPAAIGGYAGAGRYVANSGGIVHVAKREAEADPYLLGGYGLGYSGLGYAGLGYSGLGYAGLGYAGLGYAAPAVVGGYSNVSPSGSLNIAGLAPAAAPAVAGGYAAAGRYAANSAGVVHLAKREAEADPYLLGGYGLGYSGLGYAGLGYAGLGYAGLGYAGLGYAAPAVVGGYSNLSPSGSLNIAGLAPAAAPAVSGGYAAAGRYVANSAGVIHAA